MSKDKDDKDVMGLRDADSEDTRSLFERLMKEIMLTRERPGERVDSLVDPKHVMVERFKGLDARFDGLEKRMDRLEARFELERKPV